MGGGIYAGCQGSSWRVVNDPQQLQGERSMPSSKTYILDDPWTGKDALDFTPYVEMLGLFSTLGFE
jgi:hypothetical protein